MSIFRPEVAAARRHNIYGEILVARPLSFSILGIFALLVVFIIIVFLFFGEYTRKEKLLGRVAINQGLVKVYSPLSGIVSERSVNEGDFVEKNDLLFTVSVERSSSLGNTQLAIGSESKRKKDILTGQLEVQKQIHLEEMDSLSKKLNDLSAILDQTRYETNIYVKRLAISKNSLDQYRQLEKSKYISPAQLAEKEQQHLDQDARLQSLRRAELTTQAEISTVKSALRNAPLTAKSQSSNIEREISSVRQESFENEARREFSIRAPQAGQLTGILLSNGQTVMPNLPMVGLIPKNAQLEVHLFATNKAIGFIKKGALVKIRFEAFPYQKFGQYSGIIKDISRTALTSNELQIEDSKRGSLYRLTVTLDSKYVNAFGEKIQLQDGMQLEADVLLETRKLYEWALEPLYTLTGKI